MFARVAQRYQGCGRFAQGYVSAKLRRDPVHYDLLTLAAQEPFCDVVDIGCGRGQLGIALLEAGLARSVIGFDCYAVHVMQAQRAAVGLPFTAIVQDLAITPTLPEAATVILVDVLYQLDADTQRDLLQSAVRAARDRIVIRTLDPDLGIRSVFTMALERSFRHIMPHAGKHVNPLPLSLLKQTLDQAGFIVSSQPCWGKTPFANMLVMGRRAR